MSLPVTRRRDGDGRPAEPEPPSTPTALLAAVREARVAADLAEAQILRLAVEWAHSHPALPGDQGWRAPRATAFDDGAPDPDVSDDDLEHFGVPAIAWDAPATFAAANAMSTVAGRALLRDALVLQHRLPRVKARVLAGEVQAWRARRIAQAVLGAPADVVAYVDAVVARRADQVGAAVLDRLLDEAMLRLHPEERELKQLEALDRRHVTLDERTLNHTGIAEMVIRGDWADLDDFDRALSAVAAALARQGVAESLDVRRTMAVGVLATPHARWRSSTTKPRPGLANTPCSTSTSATWPCSASTRLLTTTAVARFWSRWFATGAAARTPTSASVPCWT